MRVAIVHNIIAPYKVELFNELAVLFENLHVLYLAKKARNRDWVVSSEDCKHHNTVLSDADIEDANVCGLGLCLLRQLSILNPDVVILGGYSHYAYLLALLWAKIRRKRIVLWSASNQYDHPRRFVGETIKKGIVRLCHAFNVYGTDSARYLSILGAPSDRIAKMGNTTNVDYYSAGACALRKDKPGLCRTYNVLSKNILYVGRVSHEKNIITLLNVYNRLQHDMCQNIEEWGLVLLGAGHLLKTIERIVADEKIKNVFLPGFIQKKDIVPYYAMSDLFVLPSYVEAWGLVVNEAMASHLPVVVSRKCGCSKDLVREGENGFVFDPHDEDALYAILKECVEGNYNLKSMGEASRKIVDTYSPHTAAAIVRDTIVSITR